MTAISIRISRSACAAALSALVLAWNAGSAQAQGISGIVSTNSSTPDLATSGPGGASEFRSRTAFGEAVLAENVASFEHRLSWFAGLLNDGGNAPPSFEPDLAYQVVFTVEDPWNQGYELRVSGQLRGYVRAEVYGDAALAIASLAPLQTTAFAAFEPEAIELPELGTPSMDVVAIGQTIQSAVTNSTGTGGLGRWTGTRSFMLSVSLTEDALLYGVAAGPLTSALAFMQFGRSPTLDRLSEGNNTGPGSPAMSELGHFLNVQARFIAAPIPEPATALLMVAGLGVAALRWRRVL